jgi:hypothetical protein
LGRRLSVHDCRLLLGVHSYGRDLCDVYRASTLVSAWTAANESVGVAGNGAFVA